MAERIPFNPYKEHETRDWREIEPGDFLWYVPDPDENGTVDPDEVELFVAAKPQNGEMAIADSALVFRKWSPATAAQKKNLYLAESKPSITEILL